MGYPTEDSLDKMWRFVKGLRRESGTTFHPNPAVTEVVANGLAAHGDELDELLCPNNFYLDKQAKAKLRRWICACDEMQIYNYCHCLLSCGKTACRLPSIYQRTTRNGRFMDSSPTRLQTRDKRSGTGHRIMVPYHSPTTPGQRLD